MTSDATSNERVTRCVPQNNNVVSQLAHVIPRKESQSIVLFDK